MLSLRSVALLLGLICSSSQAQTQESRGDRYLILERRYQTDCIVLYQTIFHVGQFAYVDRLQHQAALSKLDLLAGECTQLFTADKAPDGLEALAVSDHYALVKGGLFNRHTIYDRTNWQPKGTLRFKDQIAASLIVGDTLWLVQNQNDSAGYEGSQVLSRFSLPDLKLVESSPLNTEGHRAVTIGSAFLLYDAGHLVSYDPSTRERKEVTFPFQRQGTWKHRNGIVSSIGCGGDVELIGTDRVLARTSCHSYGLFDLATFKMNYEVTIGENSIFARAFGVGDLLFVLEESSADPEKFMGGLHYDVQVLDIRTGRRIASPMPLVSHSYTRLAQFGDRLVRAMHRKEKPHGFDVEVYRLKDKASE